MSVRVAVSSAASGARAQAWASNRKDVRIVAKGVPNKPVVYARLISSPKRRSIRVSKYSITATFVRSAAIAVWNGQVSASVALPQVVLH